MSTYKMPMALINDTYSNANECHFFITTIIMIRSDKMIVVYRRTITMNFLLPTLSNLPSEVDTQQLNISYYNSIILCLLIIKLKNDKEHY